MPAGISKQYFSEFASCLRDVMGERATALPQNGSSLLCTMAKWGSPNAKQGSVP
jgi:hypothetical protein